MKYILPIIAIIFFSCKKDPSTPSGTNASGSIEFKVNGGAMVMDNVDLLTGQYVVFYKQLQGIAPKTRYLLNAQKGANNVLIFTIVTDSLQKTNYHTSGGLTLADFALNYNGQTSGILSQGDYFDINITNYSNGRISGNFTAALTQWSIATGVGQPGSVKITSYEL